MRNMFKRMLSAVTALAIVFSMMPVALAGGEAAFVVADVNATAGATVVVPVTVENNSGFGATKLLFTLPDGWSVSSFKLNDKDLLGRSILQYYDEDNESWTSNYNPTANAAEKSYTIAAKVLEDMSASGVLFYMVVSVPSSCYNGDYEIGITTNSVYHAYDTDTNIKNNFDYKAGTVTVTGGLAPHVHAYENPTYTWASNNSTCTAEAACACGETDDETVTATSSTVPAECGKNSVTTYTATFTKTWAETQTKTVEGTDALEHVFTNYVPNGDATCTADGTKTALCDNGCGEKKTVADTGSKLAHVDADKNHKCDYNCGKADMGEHKDSNADADHVCDYGCGEVLEACADKADDGDHNCDVCGKADVSAHNYAGASCNDPATCTECGHTSGTAIGHSFTNYVYNNDATCENDGTETAQCDRACGVAPDTRVKVGSKLGHAWDAGTVTTPAKCEVDGVMTYTCGNDASHTKTEPITAIGHAWDAGTVTTPAKCDVPGVMTYVCGNDASHTKTEAITAPGHAWDAGTVTTPATCSVPGVKTYTCTVDAAHTKTEEIPTLEHTYGSNGKCTVCGAVKPTTNTGSSAVPSFDINVKDSANGEIEVKSEAKVGEMVVVTAVPDKGFMLEELIISDKNGDKIKTTKNADGTFTFKMPVGDVEVEAVFAVDNRIFTDVNEGDYFFNAVQWAAENGITNGMTATTFVPNGVCNRAQVVTFLWRAAGCPAPKSNVMPFTDVAAGAYYYNAVLWAVENGITNGMSATEFAPNATVTRGQTVTFLWRAEKGGTVSGESKFVDVEAGAYYADAVQWAVANGITNGMSATEFAPMSGCTRGQIVTFLYRTFAK